MRSAVLGTFPLSARALGVYVYLQETERPISAEALAKVFPEGRKAMLTALKELRDAGLIVTSRTVLDGKFVTYSQLQNGSPKKALLSQLNSLLSTNTNSYIDLPNSERSSRKEKMEYYETEEERQEARLKHEAQKRELKLAAHESKRQERMARREVANAKNWSITDSTFEFADQMHHIWDIPEWSVTRSRFRYALGTKRSEYGTDGELERQMMILFFGYVKVDKSLRDPELIWKRFIIQFPNLLEEAKRQNVTVEHIDELREAAKPNLDWLNDV